MSILAFGLNSIGNKETTMTNCKTTDSERIGIDIVIAWVDGNDSLLREKRNSYKSGKILASDAVASTRFASDNEIYYNIASIIKYVPFCRYIYIVTDNQKPEFLDEFARQGVCVADKIKVIDHKDIFAGYEQFLPTFNTRSIETMLCNIPKLSDHFIYMNDDFFFNQPVTLDDFLAQNNIIIHGHWNKNLPIQTNLKSRKLRQKLFGTPIQPRHVMAQMLSADILGMKRFFKIQHYPHIVDRKALKSYLTTHPQFLETQIKYKFRDIEQVNPIALTNHLKIKVSEAYLKPDTAINYIEYEDSIDDFINSLQNSNIKYGCIQSLDQLGANAYQKITRAMIEKFEAYLPLSVTNN